MTAGRFFHDLMDLFYAPVCVVCTKEAERWPVCPKCELEVQKLEVGASCPKCAMPVAEHGLPCPRCMGKGLPPIGRVLRLGNHSDALRELVHLMKYKGHWSIGEFLGDRLMNQPDVAEVVAGADVIVPVPLHPRRQIARGYNQAEVLARRLARKARKKLAQPLARLVHTPMQVQVRAMDRRVENMKNAFGLLSPGVVRGRRVILVDDVRTTGATLQSVARCLREGEPESVDAVVVTVADPKQTEFELI